jgi:hypothetical protein
VRLVAEVPLENIVHDKRSCEGCLLLEMRQKIPNTTVGELRQILERLPDDADVLFSVDVDNWPETETVDWDDGTRVMSVGWDGINIDFAGCSYMHPRRCTAITIQIVGEFNNGDTSSTT